MPDCNYLGKGVVWIVVSLHLLTNTDLINSHILTLFTPKGLCCKQVNTNIRYVHSCLDLATLISILVESKWFLNILSNQFGSQGLVWLKIQEPLSNHRICLCYSKWSALIIRLYIYICQKSRIHSDTKHMY